jgi:glycosyltransferase involved in cell wall biosynthesis
MTHAPRASVLLPVRDAEPWLKACLGSVLSQQLEGGFEVLALEHGSQDGSAEILRQAALSDSRLRVLSLPQAPSLPGLLQQGLELCRAPYVARMDADDLCLPGRLQAQADLLDGDARLGLAGCGFRMISESGPLSAGYAAYAAWANGLATAEAIARELFVECPLPHPTWMLRREAALAVGGYRDDGLPEDYHLLLRLARAGWGLAKAPGTLFEWRDHSRRHSRLHARYRRQAFFSLKARFIQPMLCQGRPCVVYGAGERARMLVRSLQEAGAEVAFGICLDSMPATRMHGAPVLKASEAPKILPGPMLACVGDASAKPEIRAWAAGRGMVEGSDWWMAS